MFYVVIKKLNGRYSFSEMADKLKIRGFEDRVEYHAGGWDDMQCRTVLPHLKFENGDDALAYTLAFGGNVSTIFPTLGNILEGD